MTDWNQKYESEDTPWDKGEAAPPLIGVLSECDLSIWGNGRILVPGCGAGHDVRALATLGLDTLGLDIAPLALERARDHEKAGPESYELGDFLDPEWGKGRHFSAIWEHTCFCAINPSQRSQYARSCANLIPSGGHLIGVFFLTPNEPEEEEKGPPFNASVSEIDGHFAPWFDRIDSWVPKHCYPDREGKEWTVIYRRKNDQ